MKQKIYVLIISVIALVMIAAIFIFGINYNKRSNGYFADNGYIISNVTEGGTSNVNKLYFNANSTYKNNKNDGYIFSNSDGEKVSVDKENFVHYSSGSIMSLKKGVAIDLEDIDSKLISYYNIFEGSILVKKNDVYEINNLNDAINFSKLMFKISNSKYLVAYPKIVVSFSDDQTIEMEDYVEIEYVSENVIRVYNDKVNYQTIASDLYLIMDNIKIDLGYKTISKNDVQYLTMADMVINADDNIEVLPLPDEIVIPEDSTNNNNSNNNSGGGTGETIDPGLQEGLENIIGTLPEQPEEDPIVQPKFTVESMEVTTLGFKNLKITLEDESAILYGERVVEVLENSTGKIVQVFENWEEGRTEYKINSFFSLKPGKAYTLNVTGQYKVDDTVYDRTFVSKMFRTLDIGLEVMDDYRTNDSLSFVVYKNSYSDVSGFIYNITNKEGVVIVEDKNTNFNNNDSIIITEENKFNSNTEYFLNIKNIQYGNDVFSTVSYEELKVVYETKTLKSNPLKKVYDQEGNLINNIKLQHNINNQKGSVTLGIAGINDINNGIKEYTYNIYNRAGDLKKTITKDGKEDLSLSFDELSNEDIYFNVEINFDDNEKNIVYISNNSELINISGITYPKVVDFVKGEGEENCETIVGEIILDDSNNFLAMNDITSYKIDIKENSNSSLTGIQQHVGTITIENTKTDGKISLPVRYENLIPNTEYVLYVYISTYDAEGNKKYIYLGYDTTSTSEPENIYLNVNHIDDYINEEEMLFDFEIIKNQNKLNSSLNNLKNLKMQLYRCSKVENSVCEEVLGHVATLPRSQDSLELQQLRDGDKIKITSFDFDFTIDDYENMYDYKVIVTGEAKKYKIHVIINDTESNEFQVEFNEIAPVLDLKATEILNEDCKDNVCTKDENLDDTTAVGLKLEINSYKNPMGQSITNMVYEIYEADLFENGTCTSLENDDIKYKGTPQIINSSFQENIIFDGNTLKRGVKYCIKYYGNYKGNQDNDLQTLPKYEPFFAEKQSSQISGHINNYNANKLEFDLNIIDPDATLKKDSLVIYNTLGTQFKYKNHNYNTDEYEFTDIISGEYKLKIKEDIGNGDNEVELYNFTLDEIFSPSELNMIIDTNYAGKVVLWIPCEGSGSALSNNLSSYADRIVALSIKSNNGETHYFNLEKVKNEENVYERLYTEINLNDLNSYGTLNSEKNVWTLNSGDIKLVYDSGKTVNTGKVFIKRKISSSDGKNYFDLKNEFNTISINSIYNLDAAQSDLFQIQASIFKANQESSSIGKNLIITDKAPVSIKYNEVASQSLSLYNIDGNKTNSFDINQTLTTSKIDVKYTATGANVSFEIFDSFVDTGTKLKIKLMGDNNNIVDEAEVSATCSNEVCTWTESSEDKITHLSINDNNVTVNFDNIEDKNYYTYNIEYAKDDAYALTYNNDSKVLNENIEISSLKFLVFNEYSANLTKKQWYWTNQNNDLNFIKKITSYFEVDTSKYQLSGNEKIVYTISAQTETSTIDLIKDQELSAVENDSSTSKNTIETNLFEVDLPVGIYKIVLKPVLIKSDNQRIALKSQVLESIVDITKNDNNIFGVASDFKTTLFITINDTDGLLDIPNVEYDTNKIMGYVNEVEKRIENYYNKNLNKSKVVYLELYSVNDGNEKYIGYSPITFDNISSVLNLKTYFIKNNLDSGDYKVKIKYSLRDSDEIKIFETEAFKLYNVYALNHSLITFPDSYAILLKNPNQSIKESIKRVVYQYVTIDGETHTKELSNLDDRTINDIYYASVRNEDNTIDYYLKLNIDVESTSLIRSIEIKFYDAAGYVVTELGR